MYKLIIENLNGVKFDFSKRKDYVITDIDGLTSLKANINNIKAPKIENRNIAIDFSIPYMPESPRIELYRYIKVGDKIKLYFQNGKRSVWIEGVVEDFNVDIFTKIQQGQIIIVCEKPYFKDLQIIKESLSTVNNMFEFPFSCEDREYFEFGQITDYKQAFLTNEGDTKCGFEINLIADDEVINPIIYNYKTREFFKLEFTMQAGDFIKITTGEKNKRVILKRNAEDINIFNYISKGSKWLQLDFGTNVFTYDADVGKDNLTVNLIYQAEYEGV